MKSSPNQNLPDSASFRTQDGSQNEWGWSKAKLGANAILVPRHGRHGRHGCVFNQALKMEKSRDKFRVKKVKLNLLNFPLR